MTLKRTISHKSSVMGGSIEANSIEVGGNVKGRHTGSINV